MDSGMMKRFFFQILMFICGAFFLTAAAPLAVAQTQMALISAPESPAAKPALTPPFTIAMIFDKLTKQEPDFESIARQTQAYINSTTFDQSSVLAEQVEKIKGDYNLLTLSEPIIIESQVKLSPYNAANHGFFVENFKLSTFFPVSYNGKSYAVVPQGIMDKQWLKVEDQTVVASIESAAKSSDRLLTMILFLTPQDADGSSPAIIDGESYWPISAGVKKLMLYPLNGDTLLWQSSGTAAEDKNHQNILNLYQ